MQHAKDYGLSAEKVGFDPAAVVKRSRAVSKRLNDGVGFLMKKNKVDRHLGRGGDRRARQGHGEGRPRASRRRARSAPGSYQAKHIIIATGARPRVLPGLEPDKKLVWTYFEAMVPDRMPKSLLVIGSGAIGIEFASFYRALRRRSDGGRGAAADPARRGRRDLGVRAQAVREAGHQDLHRCQGDQARQESRQRHRHHRRRQGRHADAHGRARDLRRRRHRQYRESRPREGGREDRTRCNRGRSAQPHQCARHLRHRRRRRSAAARAQGRARGCHLRRGDQGAQAASHGQAAHSRLHLLRSADRLGRAHRAGGEGEEARGPGRPVPVRRQRQGDRARRGPGPRQGDLRQEDRRAASARTWWAPR